MAEVVYYLYDAKGLKWPDALPWRGKDSRRGYATEEAARRRIRQVHDHYNAHFGISGPDLRVGQRSKGNTLRQSIRKDK